MPLGFDVGVGKHVFTLGVVPSIKPLLNVRRFSFPSGRTTCGDTLIDGVCAPGPAGLERAERL